MPDAMCLGKLDANAYTEDDDNVVEEGIEFWRPRAKYSETHSPFLGRASYWLLPAVSLIIFDFGFVARCYIFFYSLRQKRNKIEGAACWLSYFISQREACIVFDFFFSSILLFIFEVRHLRWISFFFRAFRVAVIIGKAPNCFRVNASKFRFYITGEMMIVRFNWTSIQAWASVSMASSSANLIQMKRNVFDFTACTKSIAKPNESKRNKKTLFFLK